MRSLIVLSLLAIGLGSAWCFALALEKSSPAALAPPREDDGGKGPEANGKPADDEKAPEKQTADREGPGKARSAASERADSPGSDKPGEAVTTKTAKSGLQPRADGEDWPSFRGGALLQGNVPLEEPLGTPELVWERKLEGPIDAAAAIVDGVVYIGTLDGFLHALRLETGEPIWRVAIEDAGFGASPLVYGERLFVGDDFGVFRAFSTRDGSELWNFDTQAEIRSSATTDGERVLFGSYDGFLHCRRLEDGAELWKFETQGQVHSSPALVEGKTFVSGCDQHFRVIDVQSGKEVAAVELGGYTAASPAVDGDRAYVATFGNQVIALDWKELESLWVYSNPRRQADFYASCAIGEQRIVAAGRDRLVHGIDRASGKGVWTFRTRSRVDSSPVIAGASAFVGSNDGSIYKLALEDGVNEWSFTTGSAVSASPAIARGRLVIGNNDGKLFCFAVGAAGRKRSGGSQGAQ